MNIKSIDSYSEIQEFAYLYPAALSQEKKFRKG